MTSKPHKIIITGAASGFGSFLAEYLLDKSEKLFLIDINSDGLQKFNGLEGINIFNCDLTDYVQTTAVIKEIFEEEPEIDILINNAGIIHSELLINFFNRPDRRHSKENWDKMLNVNLTTVFNCSVNVIDNMIRNKACSKQSY